MRITNAPPALGKSVSRTTSTLPHFLTKIYAHVEILILVSEWIVLPEIFVLTAGALCQTKTMMAGLQVYPKNMMRNLKLTKGLIVSEAVMMGLGSKLGRQSAHDLVYDCCRRASLEDRQLIELLKENKDISAALTDAELEQLCDPANYLGLSATMTDNVVDAYKISVAKDTT